MEYAAAESEVVVPESVAASPGALNFDPLVKILHVIGKRDAMNPPEQGMKVAEAFGPGAQLLEHGGGHTVPLDDDALDAQVAKAGENGRWTLVDFYADWCVECVEMEHGLFADPDVRDALSDVAALQVDVTDYDAADRALMRELDVFGPPTVLFYRPNGNEADDQRLIGKIGAAGFIARIQRLNTEGTRP